MDGTLHRRTSLSLGLNQRLWLWLLGNIRKLLSKAIRLDAEFLRGKNRKFQQQNCGNLRVAYVLLVNDQSRRAEPRWSERTCLHRILSISSEKMLEQRNSRRVAGARSTRRRSRPPPLQSTVRIIAGGPTRHAGHCRSVGADKALVVVPLPGMRQDSR